MLRLSQLFSRTLRDDPADAEVASHKLLVRAGYVRRTAPGIYAWLPLGLAVVRAIEAIVREEMDAIGAQEVLLPALLPREVLERTGRWTEYGDALFRLRDRKGVDYLLGPTHEEMFTLLCKGEVTSYRDLPLSLYQIQAKYRDEARPRAGVIRGREFTMKDSYSFDLDDAGLAASYAAHRGAYERIFSRIGLRYRIVAALSGAMGGSASEEFLAPTPAGEDTFVHCSNCDYAANVEAVEVAPAPPDTGGHPPATVIPSPGTPTIATLVAHMRSAVPTREWGPGDTLKNVVLRTRAPGGAGWTLLVIGVPGDREVDLKRVEAQLEPLVVEAARPEDLEAAGLVTGYIGPAGVLAAGVRYLTDPAVAPGSAWVTGADREGHHAYDVVAGRDFAPDGTIGAVVIGEGEPCVRCGSPLEVAKGIELGHVFQLGRKYTDAYEVDVAGPDGTPVRLTMGSYGIGVTRAVAALAEQTHDGAGLAWPASVAPAQVHLVVAGKDEVLFSEAERIGRELESAGLRVLVDDRRSVSAGVKFKDAELLGMPVILTVGRKLADGLVEVRRRAPDERRDVAVGSVVAELGAALAPG